MRYIGIVMFVLMFAACTRTYDDAERKKIATAYAETLIARNTYRTDSTAMRKALDSIARVFGYSNERELLETVAELAEQPEELHRTLDTAERYLQRVLSGEQALDSAAAANRDSLNPDSVRAPGGPDTRDTAAQPDTTKK